MNSEKDAQLVSVVVSGLERWLRVKMIIIVS
jgi:hypothetical protein